MNRSEPSCRGRLAAQRVALPAAAAGACSAPPLPDGPCPVCPHLAERFEPFRQAAYWKRMHQLAVARQAELSAENESLRAQLRLREQQLFGTKSEAGAAGQRGHPLPPSPSKPRGQQPGKPGPTRRDHSHLPAVEEVLDLPDEQRHCSLLRPALRAVPRHRGRRDPRGRGQSLPPRLSAAAATGPPAAVAGNPGIITAPPPAKLIPKSILGVSIWVEVLLDKYLFYRPTYRLLAGLEDPRPGSVAGHPDRRPATAGAAVRAGLPGIDRTQPGAEPLARRRDALAGLRHASKARWATAGRCGSSTPKRPWSSCWTRAAPTTCPRTTWGRSRRGSSVVDRYSAYKAMKQVKDGADPAGLLLGARATRLPGGGAVLAERRRLGVGLGASGSASCTRPTTPAWRCGEQPVAFAAEGRRSCGEHVAGDGRAGGGGVGRARASTRRGRRCW